VGGADRKDAVVAPCAATLSADAAVDEAAAASVSE
jgi:hypothetical protein